MADYRLSAPAEAQIDAILDWSEDNFGEAVRERYAALLVKAIEDVADQPHRESVLWKRLTSGEVGVYHIRHSRGHIPDVPGPIKDPKHYLVFRIGQDGIADILGFIHERMLFDRALRRILNANRGTAL